MLKVFRRFKQNLEEITNTQAQSATVSQVEKEALSDPGIVGLAAIWDVYDMWI